MESSQPDYIPTRTVEVVAEDYGVSPAKVHRAFQFVKVLREIGKAYDRQKAKVTNPEGHNQHTIEVKGQPDLQPNTYEVVAEDYGVSPKKVQRAFQFVEVLREIGKAYDRQKAKVTNPEGHNQHTIEVGGQPDYQPEPKTVEVVAEDYGVSPAKVHRATDRYARCPSQLATKAGVDCYARLKRK